MFYLSIFKKYKLIDKFIAVSSFVKDKHIQTGIPSEDIVVKTMADLKKIEKIIDDFIIHTPPSGIVFAGRVSKAKGTEILKYLILNLNIKNLAL